VDGNSVGTSVFGVGVLVGGTGFEPVTSAMCLDSSPDLLVSYLAHLDSRGLSEHYTSKINEYIGKYL